MQASDSVIFAFEPSSLRVEELASRVRSGITDILIELDTQAVNERLVRHLRTKSSKPAVRVDRGVGNLLPVWGVDAAVHHFHAIWGPQYVDDVAAVIAKGAPDQLGDFAYLLAVAETQLRGFGRDFRPRTLSAKTTKLFDTAASQVSRSPAPHVPANGRPPRTGPLRTGAAALSSLVRRP